MFYYISYWICAAVWRCCR